MDENINEQEKLIEADAKLRQRVLGNALQQLRTLESQADWFGRIVDMSDISQFDGKGSSWFLMDRATAESRAMIYPGATAAVYINESELKQIRARSRAFAPVNPYWLAVAHSRRAYTVGSGHAYKVMPIEKDDSDEMKQLLADVSDEIQLFCKTNRWRKRQNEKITRQDRDGEFFLRFFEDHPDGVLRVRFIEPLLVWTPPGKSTADDVWFGIQYDGDYEDPQGYYIRPSNYLGTSQSDAEWRQMVPACEIQHRTVNVDMNSPRGLPTTYAVQSRLEQALKTLSNMGALVEFRTKIGLIRKHINATTSSIKTMLGEGGLGYSNGAAGLKQVGNLGTMRAGSILDTNDQTSYEFPTTNTDVEKIVASVQADLRSVAAALGLAEYMVSADASNSNYSSTMVAEGSPVKTFEGMQTDLIDDDIEVLERAIQVAIKNGRLPEDTLELVKLDAEPPVIVSRNRLTETQADEILNRNDVMGKRTWRAREDLDYDAERDDIESEKEANAGYSLDDPFAPPATFKPDLPPPNIPPQAPPATGDEPDEDDQGKPIEPQKEPPAKAA